MEPLCWCSSYVGWWHVLIKVVLTNIQKHLEGIGRSKRAGPPYL